DLYADLEARVVHVLEYGNISLENSDIGASLRLVHLEEIDYSESVLIDVAYNAMLSEEGVFSGLSAKRKAVGADLVIFFRSRRLPSLAGEDTCGLGTMPNGQSGDFKSISGQEFIATAYIDCRDRVTIHELGHNMGLAHDRREALSRGTFTWSKGHAVDHEFATIMAYREGFPGSWEIGEFSSPDHICQVQGGSALPCGITSSDPVSGADAALSLETVRFQVARWAPDPPDTDADGVIDFEDLDDDNDGFLDTLDAFSLDASEYLDTDSDGIGNNADTDDDNDGMSDIFEISYGFDPLDASDANADSDGDGESNLVEFNNGTNPTDATSVTSACLKPELDAPIPSDSIFLNEKKLYIANPGSNTNQQTFLRFINNNSSATEVELYAIDDSGTRSKEDPLTFTIPAQGAKQMNAQDIENGNVNKGITTTLCDGQGKWQLVTRSSNPIEVMGLIRTSDGFLTSLNDVVPQESGSNIIYFANPASNTNQQTFIRVVNTTANSGTVTIAGIDDSGAASAGSVSFALTPNQAKQMTVQDLENGNLNKGLSGSLGDGTGKWRLTVTSALDLKVMSLIRTKDGFLTNLSGMVDEASTGSHKVYFANPASQTDKQTFLRIINKDDAMGTVTISAIDDNGNIAPNGDVTFTLDPLAAKQMVASDLEYGNLNKGLTGYLGSGSGRWQLMVTSSLNLEVMSLVRTPDGFLTNLSRTAPLSAGVSEVFIFNPASNTNQRSSLRIVNTSSQQASVTIQGFDDTGAASSNVTFNIIGNSALSITSQELESGSTKFVGALGDGAGKWRLKITSSIALQVQSLLDTPTGFITNLSRVSD
ncbi:MAG: zinc-dependent metalloprotease family protein, partial [Pseudomonadota bacterium]|nr:zinc-dependent metalloprotease family protein [Pseudomonadota bacterium]